MANATPPTTPKTPLLLLRGASNERKTTTTTKKKKKKPLRDRAFEKCSSLLRRLLRHRHAWLFDAPVDVRGLGLRDYYAVIRSPMDLGTVRARLEKGRYRSPGAFAADVRLTFRNAMAYNFRGDDAYAMAEELSEVFETRWAEIEDEFGDALDSLGSAAAEDSSSLDLMVLEGDRNDEKVHEVIYIGDEEEENKADVQNLPSSSVVGGIHQIGSSSDPGISSRVISDDLVVLNCIDDLYTKQSLYKLERKLFVQILTVIFTWKMDRMRTTTSNLSASNSDDIPYIPRDDRHAC